jgi:tripartite-type tricarboxylate transporter receptor subunit TctC
MTHRPYEAGSVAPYDDLASGAVDVYFDNVLACVDRIANGEVVQPLAVSAAHRTEILPDVPTMIECGYPEHVLEVWLAVFGANLAPDVMADLGSSVAERARLAARVEQSRRAWTRALASASS